MTVRAPAVHAIRTLFLVRGPLVLFVCLHPARMPRCTCLTNGGDAGAEIWILHIRIDAGSWTNVVLNVCAFAFGSVVGGDGALRFSILRRTMRARPHLLTYGAMQPMGASGAVGL